MNVLYFLLSSNKWPWQSTISKTATVMFFSEARIFNNVHPEILSPFPKNNNPNISAYFFIIAKFLFMFCSWITSISLSDLRFLLGGICVLETFLHKSSTFLNIGFLERLKRSPSQIIISVIAILRQVSLEAINFW